MIGFIKLYRKLLENPLASKPNYLAVWMYLLLMANYKDRAVIWNNKKRIISRGSFIGSIDKIARHFNLSKNTVSRILNYLQRDGMIVKKSNPHFTEFIISNYEPYQERNAITEHDEEAEGIDNKGHAGGGEEKRNAITGYQENTGGLPVETTKKYKKEKKLRINTFAIENLPVNLNGECFIKTEFFFVTKSLIDELKEKLKLTISDEDLSKEFYKMGTWLNTNKPKNNYKMFFVNWLSKTVSNQNIKAASKSEFPRTPLMQDIMNKTEDMKNGQA